MPIQKYLQLEVLYTEVLSPVQKPIDVKNYSIEKSISAIFISTADAHFCSTPSCYSQAPVRSTLCATGAAIRKTNIGLLLMDTSNSNAVDF